MDWFLYGNGLRLERVKEKMQKSAVLISPDFKKPYIIQTDASNIGLESVYPNGHSKKLKLEI